MSTFMRAYNEGKAIKEAVTIADSPDEINKALKHWEAMGDAHTISETQHRAAAKKMVTTEIDSIQDNVNQDKLDAYNKAVTEFNVVIENHKAAAANLSNATKALDLARRKFASNSVNQQPDREIISVDPVDVK